MRKSFWFLVPFLLLVTSLITTGRGQQTNHIVAAAFPSSAAEETEEIFVVRIYYDDPAEITLLATFDVFEYNNPKEGYVLAAVNAAEMETLQTIGFTVIVDVDETAVFNQPVPIAPTQGSGIPGFACYRTVEETYATAQDIVTNYPNLASWIDIGDSWEKETEGGADGYDLQILKLTNAATSGDKPVLFIMAAIHAREYTTAELNTRFAEMLVAGYGNDADITWLLDYHEIHLLLITNPDGRKQAETGLSWRKNTNENYCSPTSNSRGADLNRNFDFQWGCCSGSSGIECDSTFRGPAAASEPETQAVQTYVRSIFPDQRGDELTDAAPEDAMGVFIDIHSYSELVIWPWGWENTVAPNGTALQTLGRKLARFNNYSPKQAVDLYPTDGTTDDFAYGDLGVAAFAFELGTAFFQSCSIFENTIVPTNLPALLYAAKASRLPYLQPSGPEAVGVTLSAGAVAPGTAVELTAVLDDTQFNNENGIEPTQPIAAVEYYIDLPDWDGGTPIAMAPQDGTFDSPVETAAATIDTTNLSSGKHIIFVRGQDSDGNWGVVTAEFLSVLDAAIAPHINGFVREAGTNAPIGAIVTTQFAPFATTTNPTNGYYDMFLPEDSYDITVKATNFVPQTRTNIAAANYQIIDQNFFLNPLLCTTYNSIDVPVPISANGPQTITSTLIVTDSGPIYDINVLNLNGTHSYMEDLNFNLRSPANTNVRLMDPTCGSTNDFNLNLDDDAPPGGWPCPPIDGGTYRPHNPLATFNSEEMNGEWTLIINDIYNADGGSLDGWSLEICREVSNCTQMPPVTPTSSINLDGTNVDLAWVDAGANAGGYEIHRSATPYFTPQVATTITAVAAGSSTYADNGAAGSAATNYFYFIRALNCGYSTFADSQQMGEFDFTIQPGG
ncbi:MAG: proprotein convertase P-domain-containing protein [Anaerolineales bacterium]|nr:proprotein convertase P-domain-containing protein [Anaerolineales bacterium]